MSDRSDFPYFYANEIIILLFFMTMQYEVIVTTFWGLKNVSKKKKELKHLFDIHSIEKSLCNKLKIFPASKAGTIRTKQLYQKLLVIFCFDSKEC